MLWPLWNRAFESRQKKPLINDPWSCQLVEDIDYDFLASFGKPNRFHGVRSRVCDDLVADFLRRHADNVCIVALGEGLETQYWRLGEPDIPWYSVDLPESIATRQRLLPAAPNVNHLAYSALDFAWMDKIPMGVKPFISAMGLLMYFSETEVRELFAKIADRFPCAEVFFDAIPPVFSRKTLAGHKITPNYTAPAMPWGISIADIVEFFSTIVGVEPVSARTYAEPYPAVLPIYFLLSKITPIRRHLAPSLVHVRVQK